MSNVPVLRRLTDRSGSRRAQSLVEFALVLPLILMLVLGGVDFGRVFFGSVALTNASRVGANYAALHPHAWDTPGNASERAEFAAQIRREADAAAIKCTLPASLPAPVFPSGKLMGDPVLVRLSCQFSLIFPFMSTVLGGPVTAHAESVFPIRSGCAGCPSAGASPSGAPTPEPTPVPPCTTFVPDMRTFTLAGARNRWTTAGFTGAFTPNGHNTEVVLTQTTTPGSNPGDCIPPTSTVNVTYGPAPTPQPSPACAIVPNMVGTSLPAARAAWTAAAFTGAFSPASPTGDSDFVISQTTTPGASPGACIAPTASVTVTHGPQPTPIPTPAPCNVPSFIGTGSANAQQTWNFAGFTTTITFQKPGQLPYTIRTQDRVGGSSIPCYSTLKLGP